MQPELDWNGSESVAVGWLRHRWLLVYACLMFFSNSCAKELPTYEPSELPVSVALEQLEQRRDRLTSFRAVGNLRVLGEKRRWSGRAFLLSEIPHSLRLEVVGFFGQPVLYVASDGDHFLVWEPGQNRAYKGLASNNTLASLINIPLKDREALLLLAGIVPRWNYEEARLFRLRDSEDLMLQLEDSAGQLTQRVWLEGEELVVTKFERLQGKKRMLAAIFSDFVAIQGSQYPRSIVMEGARVRLSLRYEQFALNEPMDESVFQLTLPAGIEIHPW